jgi:hypothetical protein
MSAEAAPPQDARAADGEQAEGEAARSPPSPGAGPTAAAPPSTRAAEIEAHRRHAEALARYDGLRRTGRLRVEVRTFPGCEGEASRRVERDPEGRVVFYAREVVDGGRRIRVEAVYGVDGWPVQARAVDPTSGEGIVGVKVGAPPASEIDIDAPPRCR